MPRLRVAYLRDKNGVIRRRRVRDPSVFGDRLATRAEWNQQKRDAKKRRLIREQQRRAVKKADNKPPVRTATPTQRRERKTAPQIRAPRVPSHLLEHYTLFRAAASTDRIVGPQNDPYGIYGPDSDGPPPGMISGPGSFYSTQARALGQVRFEGVVPLEELIAEMNDILYIVDEQGRQRDFRSVYPRWEYRYIVIEKLRTGGGERIITDVTDSR